MRVNLSDPFLIFGDLPALLLVVPLLVENGTWDSDRSALTQQGQSEYADRLGVGRLGVSTKSAGANMQLD
jgi:hypothetical protein